MLTLVLVVILTALVFEFINDRGVRLRPYEILKGKLLGQIDKIELDSGKFNDRWETCVKRINRHKSDEIDAFFTYYLKAKFADNRKAGQRFDKGNHPIELLLFRHGHCART